MRTYLVWIVCLGVTTASMVGFTGRAAAQAWLGDRERTQGRGLRVGNLEVHPGVGAEVGYDSNLFYSDTGATGAAMLRITPHLSLSTLSEERTSEDAGDDAEGSELPPAINFKGTLSGSIYHYFTDRSRDNVSGELNLRLTINPERPFSVTIHEEFGRQIRPFTENPTSGALNFARDRNNAGIALSFGTRGSVFRTRLAYSFAADFFESDVFSFANNFTHSMEIGSTWKFLPQTAFMSDARVDYQTYPDASMDDVSALSDSWRVRARVGMNGALTMNVSALALIGYSAGFYDASDEFDSVVGTLELRWKPAETFTLSLGYDREYFASQVGNFNRRDRVYSAARLQVAGAFQLGLDASLGFYDFGTPTTPTGELLGNMAEREDLRLTTSLFAEYRATDWLGFNGTLTYVGDFTDFEYSVNTSMGPVLDPAEYQKFEAWFGVRVFL